MILCLLWLAAMSSRLTIFLILLSMSQTSLNWTLDWRRARVISFKHSFKTFSSMMIALLIYWRARDMLPPNWANTIFAQRLEIRVRVKISFFFFWGGGGRRGIEDVRNEMEVVMVVTVVVVISGGDGELSIYIYNRSLCSVHNFSPQHFLFIFFNKKTN